MTADDGVQGDGAERPAPEDAEHPAPEDAVGPDDEAQTGGDEAGGDEAKTGSPELEHLDETIKEAQRAADQALAPQRDE